MSDLLGTRVSHYRIVDFLSRGGMGEVYVGFDEKLGRRVVMKSIRSEHRLIAEAKTRFLREARILSQLAHPNICQIFDYIEGEDADFLVLEMISGRSLAEGAARDLDLGEKLRIARQIADVLVITHAQGIIHRDLKPDNIMLTAEGQVKVLDFGLSRSQMDEATLRLIASATGSFRTEANGGGSGRSQKLTEAGIVMGTLQYMSPEQARGSEATPASDLYSLGLVLQELFTGSLAYEPAADFEALRQRVIAADTRPMSGSDSHLAALVERLKSLAPAARPAAVDVAERLAWIQGKPARRRKKVLLAAGVAALAVFAAAMALQTRRAVRAERTAEAEAAAAKQISGFLVELFQVPDPSEGRGRAVTAGEILDEGARRIEADLAGQPLVQARLMDTIGNVYINLGLFRSAQEQLDKALRIRQARLGADDPDLARSLNSLALLYKDLGRYREAEPLYERSLAIRERALGPGHPDVADSLNNLAVLHVLQGMMDRAEPLYRRALEIREKALGPGHKDVATSLSNLAWMYFTQGLFEKAEPLYRRALDVFEHALGPDHPDLGITLNNLGALYYRQGRYADALPVFRRALEIKERALPVDHPDLAPALNNLAMLYRAQGRRVEAGPLLERALRIREKSLGPSHPELARSLFNLGRLYREDGRVMEARPLLERARAMLEQGAAAGPGLLADVLREIEKVNSETVKQ